MTKPLISFVYVTYRPGGIDLLAMSMAPQRPYYELIVVDDYLGRVERGEARKYLEARGVRVGWYGTGKAKSCPETPLGFANAMNTGAAHAQADHVVFLHDYTYIPPDATDHWLTAIRENGSKGIVSGIAQVWPAHPPVQNGDITIWEGGNPLKNIRGSFHEMWIPELLENFYTLVPVRYFYETNGIDERADGHIAWPLECMTVQAWRLGYRLSVDRKISLAMFNHREWTDQGEALWHAAKAPVPVQEEPGWTKRSHHPWSFAEAREEYLREIES